MSTEERVRPMIERGINQVFRAARRLENAELVVMRAVWEDADTALRQRAIEAAKARIRRTERTDLVDGARSEIQTWIQQSLSQTESALGSGSAEVHLGYDVASVRRNAVPPLLDALMAVIAADGLADSQRATLLKPLRHVAHPGYGV
jgi:hypothetical protein